MAIKLLLSGKTKFDMVMADINCTDRRGFDLLKEGVNINIPIILMSVEDNPFIAKRAIENGAYLFIKKPAPVEMLKYLWQHFMREKIRMVSGRDCLIPSNPNAVGGSNKLMLQDKVESNRNIMKIKGPNEEEEHELHEDTIAINKTRRKVYIKWTDELHEKFMDAVEQLGEGSCFPKQILELMNVSGLTNLQVASHLQRCRDNKWPSSQRQRFRPAIEPMLSDNEWVKHMPRKYGTMPRLCQVPSYNVGIRETVGSTVEMPNYGLIENMNNEPITTNASMYEQYGSLVPYANSDAIDVNYSNPMQLSDDFFNFSKMDSSTQSFFDVSQGCAWMDDHGTYGDHHFHTIDHEQNSTMPNMDNLINRSSQKEDFGSVDS